MTLFPHAVAGAALGALMPSVPLAVVVGVVSHFVLDFIPHWEPKITQGWWRKLTTPIRVMYGVLLAIDIALAVLVLIIVVNYPLSLAGAVAGVSVDLDNFLQYKFKSFPLLSKIGITTHTKGSSWHGQTKNFWWGMLTQILVIILGGLVILSKNPALLP